MKIAIIEKKEKYKWIYPINIYETYAIENKPIIFRGNADEPVLAKAFPKVITSVSNIKLEFKAEEQLNA